MGKAPGCGLLALALVHRPAILWLVVLAGVLGGYETPLLASILPS